ncbi:MAG TPA: hypothetical protein VMU88_00365 [bacterium]|nr:hypothetical protein [bacterium]
MPLTQFQDNPFYIGCLIGLFFAFYLWTILDYFSRARQTQRAFEDLAEKLGFEFYETKWLFEKNGLALPPPVTPYRPRRAPLSLGAAWGCRNILKGESQGRDILFLERAYQDQDVKDIHETLALIVLKGAGLPAIELVPRRLFDKFHRRLELEIQDGPASQRMKLIEAGELGHFKRPSHYLWGPEADEARVRALLTNDFWLYLENFPNWRLKAQGDWFLVFEENIPIPPEKIMEFAAQSSRAADFLFRP